MEDERLASYLMIALGGVLGASAITYFGFNSIAGISPELKTILIFSSAMIFIAVSFRVSDPGIKKAFYTLAPLAYITGLYHVIYLLEFSPALNFGAIVFSSALFFLIGYYDSSVRKIVKDNYLTYFIFFTLLLMSLTVAYDLSSPDVQYVVTFSNHTEFEADGSQMIGHVVAQNGFDFKKEYNPPRVNACIYPEGKRTDLPVIYESKNMIDRNSLEERAMYVRPPANMSLDSLPSTLKIEKRESCSFNGSANTLIVTSE